METIRASGILLHPTSFPNSYGIGDLGQSAYDFIDFLSKAKQKLWQILPLCPTSFGDSPYQSFSTFAGNHLLISPDILIKKGYLPPDIEEFSNEDLDRIDYGQAIEYKNNLYRKAFKNFYTTSDKNKEFIEFCETNKEWIDDYSLFVSLKDYYINQRKYSGHSAEYKEFKEKNKNYLQGNLLDDYYFGAVWSTWPEQLKNRDPETTKKWKSILSYEIKYNKFLQYEFYTQWMSLKKYANKKNVLIIGDLPIFIAFDSADTWANPTLYYLDKNSYPTHVAGVPPDYFSKTGQLWGNPLYKWNEHKKTKYEWWIRRIKSTLSLVDIIRIDHFRGFESFWSVPYTEKTAENGKWIKGPGIDLFNRIKKVLGDLPIIAEDLGVITEEIELLRDSLGFPGMKVLQFAFESDETNLYLPHNYSPNSIVYTGTHDNDTTLGWYRKTNETNKDLFRRYMNVSGECPNWDLIRLALSSVSQFAIFPLQDLLGLDSDSRMNTPGIAGGNWQWRYYNNALTETLAKNLHYLTKLFGR